MLVLFDAAPIAGGVAVFGAVAFFFVFVALAFIAFKMLRRTFRFAVRLTIAGIILAIAVGGSAAFYFLGPSKPTPRPRPAQSK